MKLLFAECCASIVVPYGKAGVARWCECTRSCCWWDEPSSGKFVVFNFDGPKRVSILGIHNGLLRAPFKEWDTEKGRDEFGCIQRSVFKEILEETPDYYLFKSMQSLIIRVRPGFSDDVRFATLEEVRGKLQPEVKVRTDTDNILD